MLNQINKDVIVKFDKHLYEQTYSYLLQNKDEQFCFLFCDTSISDYKLIIKPKKLIIFEQDKELVKLGYAHVHIDKSLINEAYYRFMESEYTALINCHSHPFEQGNVWFSGVDDRSDEEQTINLIEPTNNVNKTLYYLSFVFGQKTIGARYYKPFDKKFHPIEAIHIINSPVKTIIPTNKKKDGGEDGFDSEVYNRQILAFGENSHIKLSKLSVALIGVGGVGSILVEGLCRLGVRNIILIDNDKLDTSNLNRFQGATHNEIGQYKVDICAKKVKSFFPDVEVLPINRSLFDLEVIDNIKDVDCLIGATDNQETRYFLNRLSLQYMIPYIDGGVVIQTDNSFVTGLALRIGIVVPGLTRCFDCSEITYYKNEDVRQFFLDATTKSDIEKHGYIKNFPEIKAPAVYPLNMSLSSIMLLEFFNLFVGFKPLYWNVMMNYMELNSSLKKCLDVDNDYEPPTGLCLNCEVYKGRGDREPLSYFLNKNKTIELPNV